MALPQLSIRSSLRTWVATFTVISSVVVATGYWDYRVEASHIERAEYQAIAAIGKLKAGQLEHWQKEHLALAERAAWNPLLTEAIGEFLRDPGRRTRRAELLELLKLEQTEDADDAAVLYAPDGSILLATDTVRDRANVAIQRVIAAALTSGEGALSEFFATRLGVVHIAAAAPVHDPVGRPIAVIVLRTEAATFLYPLIGSWPTPSLSGETMLVERSGDEVLSLNELRHRTHTALSYREPLTSTERPTVQAVLGKTGVYWGNDYRGVRVLADLRAIPDSPWFLVAKIDADEILAEVRYRAMVIGAVVALCILIAAGATAYAYGRRQTGILGELEVSERKQQKTHEEFRATLYSIADAVITTDTQVCVREMNRVAERLTGWSEAEARGRPLQETLQLINATTRATVKGPAAEVLATGLPSTLDENTILIARDGTERPIADSTAPIRDDHGVVSGVVMVFSDETARSAAQLALEQSEERVRLALAAANQGFYDLNVQTGQATVSSEYATMLGYDPAEFHEDTSAWIERMHPDDRESAAGVQRDYLAGRLPVYRVEVRQRTKTGEWRWILSQGKIVERAPDGRPLRMLGTHTDITDRKRNEVALHLQSAALDAAANAVVITNRDGTIVWVNAAFSALSGYTAEEAIGKNPRALIKSGSHDPTFYKQMWDTLLAGRVWNGEITNRRKDGSLYQESLTITPVKGAHAEVTNFIAIKRDLTEEKQLQAQFLQAQKMESVGRLAGGIAHDFNNLLTVIIGSAEMAALDLAADDPLSAELREIHASGERAAALTRQLLAFSRMQILDLVVLNLNSVVTGMEGMLQRLLGERIELRVVPTAGLGNARADRGQIEQIVLNLAINARDAMPDGGRLTIETRNADLDEAFVADHPSVKPGPHVMLAISDTGIGMDAATMQRIFEPFFTTKEHGKGTGLGLSTAYGITKQSNGSIWVYSELGKGTTFRVYLPRVDTAAKADQPTAILPAVPGSGTILLVEDDEGIRHLADRVLRKAGYTVLTAGTGIEALRQLANYDGTVDLLLTDMVLPGMSGWELAEQIAHEHPSIKVLCTSGYADEAIMRNRVLDRGVPFIAKPYTVADLTRAVQEVLSAP